MFSVAFCVALLVVSVSGTPGVAENPSKPSVTRKPVVKEVTETDELATIRHSAEDFEKAFNAGDASAVAALWIENGEYVDESGSKYAGREAIQAAYAQFFSTHANTKIHVFVDSLRLLNESTAIEDGHATLDPPPADAPGVGKYTAIHVKVDGKWLMASVRDSRQETPSTYRNIADLEWLIGTWTAEEYGMKTTSVCRWVANKSFVERRYTIEHTDGTQSSGVQLIGWNAAGGHVQSWNFSSGGGYAVGVWTPHASGWTAELHGVTGNGVSTRAVNVLTKLDDNAYSWQSINRSLGDEPLPDTDQVIIKRSTDE